MRRRFFSLVGGAFLTVCVTSLFVFWSPVCAETVIDELIKQAEKGDATAQLKLGEQYRHGVMVMLDGSRIEKKLHGHQLASASR